MDITQLLDRYGIAIILLAAIGIALKRADGAISIKHWPGHGLLIRDMGTNARIWQA